MATNIELLLSNSTNGLPVLISATSGTGTLIHTAVAGTVSLDNVWLYCYNDHTATVTVTIKGNGVTISSAGIPAKEGKVLVEPGLPYRGGVEIRAIASVADVVTISGLVNRRTDS